MLPDLPYKTATRKQAQTQFGGIDRRAAAGNGAIADMTNMTSDHAPLLASRPKRYTVGSAAKPNGLFSDGERLFLADGTTLYVDGVSAGTISDAEKVFAALGKRILIWPDKKMWTEDGGLVSLESSVTASCTFADGTYAGEPAEANTILAPSGFDWSAYFRAGDAVTITGAADAGNNKTSIVREVAGNELRFYENSFTVNSTPASITLTRGVPDLDYLCVNDNRVWGCKGDTICCCKLGDPYNWNVFDGLSTDAWSWDSGTPGDFTGAVSFLGYPVFFKEEAIFKIYGSRPSNYEAMRSAATGVLSGAAKSLAIAGDVLYYLSRAGFMAYSGGMPAPVGAELERRYIGASGGSDGAKYYVSAAYSGGVELLVFDTAKRLWHREDATNAQSMAWKHGLYALTAATLSANGALMLLGTPPVIPSGATAEASVAWSAEFADFYGGSSEYPAYAANKKGVTKLQLRMELSEDSTAAVSIMYDSSGTWVPVSTFTTQNVKRSFYLPIIPHRCDHYRVKINGTGHIKVYSLAEEQYWGSALRSTR